MLLNKHYWLLIILGLGTSVITKADEPQAGFWQRESLGGNWLGLQPSAEKYGVSYELIYTADIFENLTGGLKKGGAYRGDFSFYLHFDPAGAGLWEDGGFFVHLQHEHGHGISGRYVGDYQMLSNIDADGFQQVSEFWYIHDFAEDCLWLKVGKQEANADFAFVEYGLEFIHSSPGLIPTIPLPTFPDPDWGLVIGLSPAAWFSLNTGVYQGEPNGGRSISHTLDQLQGPMVLMEPAFHYALAGLQGHFRVGGWWNGNRFERFDRGHPEPGSAGESYGGYLSWDQEIWKENSAAEGDGQGIGLFAQYGYAPEDRWEANHYLGGGIQWTGLLPQRDNDCLGLGIFHVIFSDQTERVENAETAIEIFYSYKASQWLCLKPDVQYIRNPGGVGNKDAVAIGLRCEIIF